MNRYLSAPRGRVRLEDLLAPHEPPYKSRGEAQVGRVLDRYGIPFVYEQPLRLTVDGDVQTWRPDFSLPREADQPLILEYAGMPDVPRYMHRLRYKQRVYRACGVEALYFYPQDLQGPDWPKQIHERVCQAYHRPSSMRYPARSSARAGYATPRPVYR